MFFRFLIRHGSQVPSPKKRGHLGHHWRPRSTGRATQSGGEEKGGRETPREMHSPEGTHRTVSLLLGSRLTYSFCAKPSPYVMTLPSERLSALLAGTPASELEGFGIPAWPSDLLAAAIQREWKTMPQRIPMRPSTWREEEEKTWRAFDRRMFLGTSIHTKRRHGTIPNTKHNRNSGRATRRRELIPK